MDLLCMAGSLHFGAANRLGAVSGVSVQSVSMLIWDARYRLPVLCYPCGKQNGRLLHVGAALLVSCHQRGGRGGANSFCCHWLMSRYCIWKLVWSHGCRTHCELCKATCLQKKRLPLHASFVSLAPRTCCAYARRVGTGWLR